MNESLLRINEDSSIFLLGYTLHLTRSEHKIISLIYKNQDGMSGEKIVEILFSEKHITVGNIAVHICNINKKARKITGRVLIVGNRKHGYRITEYI